jgi:hypothetical protein
MAFSASASPDLRFAKVKGARLKPERQAKKKAIKSAMDANKKKAKARDFKRCRWHEVHKCFGILESDHVEPLKMGGDPSGIRSETSNLFTCCAGVHKEFDESFHNGTIALDYLEPEKGCDGPCIGLRRFTNIDKATGEKSYVWNEVWRESRVGVPLKGKSE